MDNVSMGRPLKAQTELTRTALRLLARVDELEGRPTDLGRPKTPTFYPSNKQQLFRDTLLTSPPGAPLNRLALAKRAGISYTSVQAWHKKPQFLEWLNQERSKHVEEKLELVWKAMYDRATAGSVPAAKLFVERFDPNYKPTVKTEGDVTHHLPELSESERGQLESARQNFDRLLTTSKEISDAQGITMVAVGADRDHQERGDGYSS